MHSVSIVVELAAAAAASAPPATCPPQAEMEETAPETEADEEAEAEFEGEACLSSELARRVVLVDEADRILLRDRAQSAEPGALSACCRKLAAGATESSPGRGSSSSSPPAQALQSDASLEPMSPSSGGELAERGEISQLSMRRNTHHNVAPTSGANFSTSGSNFSRASPLAMRPSSATKSQAGSKLLFQFHRQQQQHQVSASSTAASNSPNSAHCLSSSSSSSPSSSTTQLTSSPQPQTIARSPSGRPKLSPLPLCGPNELELARFEASRASQTKHRRQSLQVSLLAGGHYYCCRDSSRSLTEEELRGEREFNKQVRSAARSPEVFTKPTQTPPARQPKQQVVAGEQVAAFVGHLSRRTSPQPALSPLATEPGASSHLQQQQQQQQQQFLGFPSNQRARRVSFGSIDTIKPQQAQDQHQRPLTSGGANPTTLRAVRKHRASICCDLTGGQQTTIIGGGGILRKLDRPEASGAVKRGSLGSGPNEEEKNNYLNSGQCVGESSGSGITSKLQRRAEFDDKREREQQQQAQLQHTSASASGAQTNSRSVERMDDDTQLGRREAGATQGARIAMGQPESEPQIGRRTRFVSLGK